MRRKCKTLSQNKKGWQKKKLAFAFIGLIKFSELYIKFYLHNKLKYYSKFYIRYIKQVCLYVYNKEPLLYVCIIMGDTSSLPIF